MFEDDIKPVVSTRFASSNPRRSALTDLNASLTCVLCGGYYVDATTIVECLHSFCKSCIIRYLEFSKYCPVCDVLVHKTRPEINLRPDLTLQDLVYKLVPGLFTKELNHRRDFLRRHAYKTEKVLPYADSPDAGVRNFYPEEEKISLVLEFSPDGKPVIDYSVEGTNMDRFPGRRYLLCPALFTVGLIKKFIALKFNINCPFVVDIFHTDESLQEHYTLMDIAYIYTWQKTGPLRLFYSIFEPIIQPDPPCYEVITIDDSDVTSSNHAFASPTLTSSSTVTSSSSYMPMTSPSPRRISSSDTCSSDDSDDPDYNPKPGIKRSRKQRTGSPAFAYDIENSFVGFQPLNISSFPREHKRRKVSKGFTSKYGRPKKVDTALSVQQIKTSPSRSTEATVNPPSSSSVVQETTVVPVVKEEPREPSDPLNTSMSSTTSGSSSSGSTGSSTTPDTSATSCSLNTSSTAPDTFSSSTSFTSAASPSSSASFSSPPRPIKQERPSSSSSSSFDHSDPPLPNRRLSTDSSSSLNSSLTSGSGYYPVIRSLPVSINFQKMNVKIRALSRLTPEQRFKIFRPNSPTREARDLEGISHVTDALPAGSTSASGHVTTVKQEPESDYNNNVTNNNNNNQHNNNRSSNNTTTKDSSPTTSDDVAMTSQELKPASFSLTCRKGKEPLKLHVRRSREVHTGGD